MLNHEFLNLIEDYIICVEDNGKITWANQSFSSWFGAEQSVKELSLFDLVFQYDIIEFYRFINDNSYTPEYCDARLLNTTKYPLWIRWKKKRTAPTEPLYLIGKLNEIFNMADENVLKMVTNVSISYFEYSLVDKFIPLNPTLRQILGYDNDVTTIHYDEYVSCIVKEDVEKFSKWWHECFINNELGSIEYRFLNHVKLIRHQQNTRHQYSQNYSSKSQKKSIGLI